MGQPENSRATFVSVLGASLLGLPVLASAKLASKSSSSFALDKSWHIYTASEAAFAAGPEAIKPVHMWMRRFPRYSSLVMISAIGILTDSARRVTKPNSVPIWRDKDVILSELLQVFHTTF